MKTRFFALLLCIALLLPMVVAGPGVTPVRAADTLYVGSGGYSTIQAAIDAAADGDTIVVAAGTYSGTANGEVFPIRVNKQLRLLGAQANVDPRPGQGGRTGDETIIDGGETGETVLQILASGVEINGFSVTGGTYDIVRESGFDSDNKLQGLLFSYNILYDVAPGDEGIQIAYSDSVIIEYNYAHNLFGDAFNICRSSNGVIRYNEAHNIATPNAGIYCYLTTNTDIIGNLVYDVDNGDNQYGNGIQMGDYDDGVMSTGGVIRDNVVHDIAQDGITVEEMSGVTVENNTVYGADSHDGAIYIRNVQNSTFTNNTVYNNDAIGVLILSSSGITLSSNSIYNNADTNDTKYPGTAGIWIVADSDASTIGIHCNSIYGNAEYGLINLDTLHTVGASSNWWGNASGPTHSGNPGGSGDAVSDYVAYSPWRTVAAGTAMTWNVSAGGSIQTAVDAACPGDIVAVAAGTYVEKVTINKSLTLQGANAGISAGAVPGTRGAESIIQGGVQIQGNNVVLDGFKIDGPATSGQNDGIYIVGGTSGLTIANNVLAGNDNSGTGPFAMEFGMYTSAIAVRNNDIGNWRSTYINPTNPGSNLLFEGNYFHNNYVGIGSDGLNDVNVQSNRFTGNTIEAFGSSNVGSDVRAHNNDFVGNGAGINQYSGQTIDATNNWWGDNSGPYNATSNPGGTGDAVSDNVLFSPWTTRVVPEVWVDDDSGPSTPGWLTDHFASIQDGIDKVDAAGKVNVAAGTYVEQLDISKNLTMTGAGSGSTIIISPDVLQTKFSSTTFGGTKTEKPVIYVHNATNVIIEKLTVDGAGKGNGNYRMEGIAYYDAGGTVQNCEIKDMRETPLSGTQHGVGIYAYNDDGEARTLNVASNTISAYQKNGVAFLGQNLTVNVTGNTITGAGPTGLIAQNGIEFALGASGTIGPNNTVSGNFWTGTYGGSNDPISDPNADGATGILFYASGSVTIQGNTLNANQYGIWSVAAASLTMEGNTITGTSVLGVKVTGIAVWDADLWTAGFGLTPVSTVASITNGNTIVSNDYGLLVKDYNLSDGYQPSVEAHNNDISGNSVYGAWANALVNAIENWWGDASGPYHPTLNPLGQGDEVSDLVTFDPWTGKILGPPTITSVDPDNGNPGDSFTVTISGTDFNGATAVSFGAGIAVDSFTVNSATQITADITIDGAASVGPRDVSVTNYMGTGTKTDGFTVQASVAAPTVSTVSPAEGTQGQTLSSVVITGTDFTGASEVSFGSGIVVNSFTVDSATQITANISIGGAATVGARDVSVTTPGGTGTLASGFSVEETPVSGPGWYEEFTSYNTYTAVFGPRYRYQTFTPDTSHYFDMVALRLFKQGNPNYTVTVELYNVDSNHLPTGDALCYTTFAASSLGTTASWYEYGLTAGSDVLAGNEYAIVLSGNGGDNSNRVCVEYQSTSGYDDGVMGASSDSGATWGTWAGDMAFREGQQGPPTVSAVSPHSWTRGATFDVIVSGSMYLGVTDVDFGEGITWNDITVDSFNRITVNITISGSADIGPRDVSVTTPLGTGTLAGGFNVEETPVSGPGWYEEFTAYDTYTAVFGPRYRYQTFAPSQSHYFDLVSLRLFKQGNPNYTVTVELYNVDSNHLPTGDALCYTTFAASSLGTTAGWYSYGFPAGGYVLAETEYAVVLSGDGGDNSNRVCVEYQSNGGYADGVMGASSDSGATWGTWAGDMAFREGQQGGPVLSAVTPNQWVVGETVEVIVSGIMLTGVTDVDFGAGITRNSFTSDSFDQSKVNITISGSAGAGPRDVSVTTALGTGTLAGGFNVVDIPASNAGWYQEFTSYNTYTAVFGPRYRYQTFAPDTSHYFDLVALRLFKQGNPNYTVTVELHNVDSNHLPTGDALCSTTFAASSLGTTAGWYEYGFATGRYVLAGNEYAIVLSGNGGDNSNRVCVEYMSTGGYAGGVMGDSSDSGATWGTWAGDMAFREGQQGAPVLSAVTPNRWVVGETVEVIVSGLMFTGATDVDFGAGITRNSFTVDSYSQITASITISGSAGVGPRVVSVTTPQGTGTLAGGFNVVDIPASNAGWYQEFTSYNSYTAVFGSRYRYQTFTPDTSHYYDMVALRLFKQGNPNYTVTVELYNVDSNHLPTGDALCYTTFAASSLGTTAGWYEYGFATGRYVLAGNEYAIVLSGNGGDNSNRVCVEYQSTSGYADGVMGASSDSGATWGTWAGDMAFREGQA